MEENKTFVRDDSESYVGSVKIADDVVGMIAAYAATEIDGVHSMPGNVTTDLLDKMGIKAAAKGVKVEVRGKNVDVFVSVVIEYGYNIPTTSQKIQERVKTAIENMTGLKVNDVDVRISGISVPENK